MDPTVVAAWIAAGVSLLTLIGTLLAQYLGYRAAGRDAEKTAEKAEKAAEKTAGEQRKQLDQTLAEQREQLDRTLDAQTQQLDRTLAEQRTRTLNERFATAAEQLGSDKPAVRLAGVYAMASLAEDWEENRQTCVDVLCAYLRMPYEPDPGPDPPGPHRLAFQANREVRHTVIRVITAHLQKDAPVSWQGLDFDFTGAVFDGGDFSQAQFSAGTVDFRRAQFSGGEVNFFLARFSGSEVNFLEAKFSDSLVNFTGAEFSGGTVDFSDARFSGGRVGFWRARFSGGEVDFLGSQFSGGGVDFSGARFSDGTVDFVDAEFSGGEVNFSGARFSGGKVGFSRARFSGGTLNFSRVDDWSVPPRFPWTDTPPPGVKLPDAGGKADAGSGA